MRKQELRHRDMAKTSKTKRRNLDRGIAGRSDEALALRIFEDEHDQMQMFIADEALAREIYKQEQNDHILAQHLAGKGRKWHLRSQDDSSSGAEASSGEEASASGEEASDGDDMSSEDEPVGSDEDSTEHELAGTALRGSDFRNGEIPQQHTHEDLTAGSSSSQAAASAPGNMPGALGACVGCGDPSITRVPCQHAYCAECLTRFFQVAMDPEQYFPPTCCQKQLTLQQMRPYLNAALAREFESKSLEFSTQDRTYCFWPRCSAFIPPGMIKGADLASCPKCWRCTCVHCKQQGHSGNCRQYQALQQTMDLARVQRWRQCICGRVIESHGGCPHMT
jgi:hypothetical protein